MSDLVSAMDDVKGLCEPVAYLQTNGAARVLVDATRPLDADDRAAGWSEIPLVPASVLTSLSRELAEARAERGEAVSLNRDYEDVLTDKRRLARELDAALHGDDNMAVQASLCDLVQPAKDLRARALAAEAASASKDERIGELEAALTAAESREIAALEAVVSSVFEDDSESHNTRHKFVPDRKHPWFCAVCGYAPHEPLMHMQDEPAARSTKEPT